MKLSRVIAGLQHVMDKHGDLECYAARDPEGNGFFQVAFEAGVSHIHFVDGSAHFVEDIYCEEDMKDYEEEYGKNPNWQKICIIN